MAPNIEQYEDHADAHIGTVKSAVTELVTAVMLQEQADARNLITDYRQNIADLNTSIDNLKKTITQVVADFDKKIQGQTADFDKKVQGLTADFDKKMQELTTENHELKNNIATLTAENERQKNEINRLNNSVDLLKQQGERRGNWR